MWWAFPAAKRPMRNMFRSGNEGPRRARVPRRPAWMCRPPAAVRRLRQMGAHVKCRTRLCSEAWSGHSTDAGEKGAALPLNTAKTGLRTMSSRRSRSSSCSTAVSWAPSIHLVTAHESPPHRYVYGVRGCVAHAGSSSASGHSVFVSEDGPRSTSGVLISDVAVTSLCQWRDVSQLHDGRQIYQPYLVLAQFIEAVPLVRQGGDCLKTERGAGVAPQFLCRA